MPNFLDFRSGINWRDPEYALRPTECRLMQNLRYDNSFIETILGTQRFHDDALDDPVSAIIPYYNDETDNSEILCAAGPNILKRDSQTNAFSTIKGGLIPGRIFSHATRFAVQYIAHETDGLFKYLGGNTIYNVGGGSTAPGAYKHIVYVREVDRLFGIRQSAILGQISWCELSDPETWDGANVERFKLKEGEVVEAAGVLFGKLIIFCTYTIWIYYVSGNEENWHLEEAPTSIGLRAFNTLRKIGSEYWFLGESPNAGIGVYAFNGSTSRKLTDHINPLLERINPEKIDLCAAEYHDDLYTLSFPLDSYSTPNRSIDLDTINIREDGVPAVYGPHLFGFQASCVLNSRHHGKEFLLADPDDNYIYKQHGRTFKSTHDSLGSVINQRFLSGIYNDDLIDVMKRYTRLGIFFRPRGYYQAYIRYYLSYGPRENELSFFPESSRSTSSGDFDVFEQRVFGQPDLSEYWVPMKLNSRGSAIQIEIGSDVANSILGIQGFKYDKEDLYQTREAQLYAI